MANLNESPYLELKQYIPLSWKGNYGSGRQGCTFEVNSSTQEYGAVMKPFRYRGRLHRHQNINQYGMFLIRQQQLQQLHNNVAFVTVTRYCKIPCNSLDDALKFNLDDRRLSVKLANAPPIINVHDYCVLIVKCIVRECDCNLSNLTKSRDCDWYVEYAVF